MMRTHNTPPLFRIRKHQEGQTLYLARVSMLTALGGQVSWTAHRGQALALHRDAIGLAARQAAARATCCLIDTVPVWGGTPQHVTTL